MRRLLSKQLGALILVLAVLFSPLSCNLKANADSNTVETAKAAAQAAVDTLAVTNDITADDIMSAVTNAAGSGITTSWKVSLDKVLATGGVIAYVGNQEVGRVTGDPGEISGTIALTNGTDTSYIDFYKTIDPPMETKTYTSESTDDLFQCSYISAAKEWRITGLNTPSDGVYPEVLVFPTTYHDGTATHALKGITYNCFNTTKLPSSVKMIIIPKPLKVYGAAFLGNTNLEIAVLNVGVPHLGAQAFDGCSNLQYVQLPSTVTTVPVAAFRNCKLKSLVVPEGVTALTESAFVNNAYLKTVVLPSTLTLLKSNNFCIYGSSAQKSGNVRYRDLKQVIIKSPNTSFTSNGKVQYPFGAESNVNSGSGIDNTPIVICAAAGSPSQDYVKDYGTSSGEGGYATVNNNFTYVPYSAPSLLQAQIIAQSVVKHLYINNETNGNDILMAVENELRNNSTIAVAWNTAFTKTNATENADGTAKGKLSLTEGNKTLYVNVDRVFSLDVDIDQQADTLKNNILNNNVQKSSDHKTYYVSNSGNDSNSGLSADQAWATLSGVNAHNSSILQSGDAVLFRRGDTFRGSLTAVSGVSYGAYGTGKKPCLYGAIKNSANDVWHATEAANVWVCDTTYSSDVGIIVFQKGEAAGIKKLNGISELTQNHDFYHDHSTGKLYLYLNTGNPSTEFSDIEIGFDERIIDLPNGASDITIENLCLKYGGGHGIDGVDQSNITIKNCELGWIGGSIQPGTSTTRYGNAIQFWQNCSNILVENNYIYQVYDAALTHQYSGNYNGTITMQNVKYKSNLIEDCTYGIEYFLNQKNSDSATMRNISFTGNIIRFAGYGWGDQRPVKSGASCIMSWSSPNMSDSFKIDNNIFDQSKYSLFNISAKDTSYLPKLSNNTYMQKQNLLFCSWLDINYQVENNIIQTIKSLDIDQNPTVYFKPAKKS